MSTTTHEEMRMPQKLLTIASFTLVLKLLVLLQVGTATAPAFDHTGIIEHLDAQKRIVVVGDVSYVLPASVRIHGAAAPPQEGDFQKNTELPLRQGMRIGFEVEGGGPGRLGRLVEVWILSHD
jgi:hypothetical protein